MYIALTWRPAAGADPAQVKSEIRQEVRNHGFINLREVFDRHLLANVERGGGSGDAFDLEESLRQKAPGRFTFTLYYVPRGYVILHSDNLADAPLQRIADY